MLSAFPDETLTDTRGSHIDFQNFPFCECVDPFCQILSESDTNANGLYKWHLGKIEEMNPSVRVQDRRSGSRRKCVSDPRTSTKTGRGTLKGSREPSPKCLSISVFCIRNCMKVSHKHFGLVNVPKLIKQFYLSVLVVLLRFIHICGQFSSIYFSFTEFLVWARYCEIFVNWKLPYLCLLKA